MGRRLYVGNLSYNTDEEALRAHFSKEGLSVTDVYIATDRDTGRPRGFAFVEMASDQEAQTAIESLDGSELDGRNLRVNEAQERGGGRGRGGGDYGRRGGGW